MMKHSYVNSKWFVFGRIIFKSTIQKDSILAFKLNNNNCTTNALIDFYKTFNESIKF